MLVIATALRNALPDWGYEITRYVKHQRRLPNLVRPRTLNEKTLYRMLFDRRDWLPMVADKYRVRDYVRERGGAHLLPDLYHVTTEPEMIPFSDLPDRFVVKPSHGSGWVEVVSDKNKLDRARLLQTCRTWLSQNYYNETGEWYYKNITPRIMVEEFIDDGSGGAPNDYKMYVYDGVVRYILVVTGRFADPANYFVDRDWNPVDATMVGWARRPVAPPPHLKQMIEAAETLARGMDFVRADFYDTESKLYFGELTVTPGCAISRFEPRSFDAQLGAPWKLPRFTRPRAHRPVTGGGHPAPT